MYDRFLRRHRWAQPLRKTLKPDIDHVLPEGRPFAQKVVPALQVGIVLALDIERIPAIGINPDGNIAKGEMSFVGPRPESPDYTKLYDQEQLTILELRPGITDFASIQFADLGSILSGGDPDKIYFEKVWDRKMALRLKYVNERSFWVDLKLIFQTLSAIFVRK